MAAQNGASENDTIFFDLPGLSSAGRTIILLSKLPDLSSRLIIDASTQPGAKFGVSGARVKIQHGGSPTFSQCFVFPDVQNVEIYGIYFADFKYGDPNLSEIRTAILLTGIVQQLKIGKPGKGNVFYGNAINIANCYSCGSDPLTELFADVEIKSNFFGIHEDGENFDPGRPPAIAVRSFRNIQVGGPTPEEGNYFSGGFNGGTDALIYMSTATGVKNGFVRFEHNSFGTNVGRTVALKTGFVSILADQSGYNKNLCDADVTITNNYFNNTHIGFSDNCNGLLYLNDITGKIRITGNRLGTLVPIFSCQTFGIGINNSEDIIIGGDSPEEQNYIAGNYMFGLSLNNNRKAVVRKNSFYCNSKGIEATSTKVIVPGVKMMSTNDIDLVAGTATPNSLIEIFENPTNCSACANGERYLGETKSDNAGNWSFTAPFSSAVTARATTPDSVSGEFSAAAFDESKLELVYPVCNGNNGSIKGMKVLAGTKFYWTRSYPNHYDTIFNQLDLDSVLPGFYRFIVEQTKYCTINYAVNMTDNSPRINALYKTILDPGCGGDNGSITNINVSGKYTKLYWHSERRDTVGVNTELKNIGQGKYKLIAINEKYGCGDSTEWITLTSLAGPKLLTNNVSVKAATCGDATGSISGITVANSTGAQTTRWVDSSGKVVGYAFDVSGLNAGRYLLQFKDEQGCDTITSGYFTIYDTTAVIIDESTAIIKPVGCGSPTGSIQNVTVKNATFYSWRNMGDNSTAASSRDLLDVPSSFYQLTARNAFGCSASSNGLFIPNASFDDIGVLTTDIVAPQCNAKDGSIRITGFTQDAAKHSFYWVDSTTNMVTPGKVLSGIGAGIFLLHAVDSNGCEKMIYTFSSGTDRQASIDETNVIIKNDICSRSQGSITGIKISPLTGPTQYQWFDAGKKVVGTAATLTNVVAGVYRLLVTDAGSCAISSRTFEVRNDNNLATEPVYDPVIVPRNSAAILSVKNFAAGEYFSYADAAGTTLLAQNQSGIFSLPSVVAGRTIYIRYVSGACSSQLVRVTVTPVDKSYFAIPTAFSPNGDLINDVLTVRVIGYLQVKYFRIYNRYGEPVFETTATNTVWDGTLKGANLPVGAYTWIAEATDLEGKLTRAKGYVLLLR